METKNVNQTINLLKLIASFFVVFIHVPFPGVIGKIADCTARFAVPFFFIVSGYYSYNVPISRIKPRIIKLFKIFVCSIIASGIIQLYECLFISQKDISYFLTYYLNKPRIFQLVTLGGTLFSPIGRHLWYLHAIIVVYCLYILYRLLKNKLKMKSYLSFYLVSMILFTIMFILSLIYGKNNDVVHLYHYRNAYLFGMPLFSIGHFIKDANMKEKLKNVKNYQLIFFVLFSNFFALIQYKYLGKTDLPMGSLFVAIFIFMLCIKNPLLSSKRLGSMSVKYFDRLSLLIYLIHTFVQFFLYQGFNINPYFFPLVVIIVSFGLSVSYLYLREIVYMVGPLICSIIKLN